MKVTLCFLLVVAAVSGAEEKKNEKRGALGLGYGLAAPAPLLGHGYYGHGLGLYGGHGYGGLSGLGGGYYGAGYGGLGHGIGLGHGLYGGHGYSAPLLSHSVGYSAPLLSHAPLFGLGHGWH